MKIILAIIAVFGFGFEGLISIINTFEYWPQDAPVGEELRHVIESGGYISGSIAGVFVAIACCLPAKQPKIMPPPVQPPITGK